MHVPCSFKAELVFVTTSFFIFYFLSLFKWQVPNQGSASGPELKAAGVTTGPLIQHRWTPMTRLYALLRLFPDREY